ncbi:MAG: hypothetical protein VXW38_12135 [Bacteroidota bacterium]|nr:hypothetical protein [Bacteroidota bacterium]
MPKKKTGILIWTIGLLLAVLILYDFSQAQYIKRTFMYAKVKLRGPRKWDSQFEKLVIGGQNKNDAQPVYLYRAKSHKPKPLIISLHTWSGNFNEYDPLAAICVEKDINYIHPNFMGANDAPESCCSDRVIEQIDDVIEYALYNLKIDEENIHIIGLSGGGYAALCHFMKSKIPITSYSSWVGISDLEAWYFQSKSQKNSFWKDILDCTGSEKNLEVAEARKRSPIYLPIDVVKQKKVDLNLFTGIHDGIRGSVPITQSINFYNRIVSELYPNDSGNLVSTKETLYLMEYRKPIGNFGEIDGRPLCLVRNNGHIGLYIFDGGHEILPYHAIDVVLKNK